MSVSQMASAWKADVTPVQKLVLLAVADGTKKDRTTTPGMMFFARKCSITTREFREAISELMAMELIIVRGDKAGNWYEIVGDDR